MDPNAINKMSQEEKLRTMEKLWESLTHGKSEPPSPTWHEEILAHRKSKMDTGEATFVTLDEFEGVVTSISHCSVTGSER